MNNKTIIEFGFRRSRRMLSTSAFQPAEDNILLDLQNSSHPTQPHSIIAKNAFLPFLLAMWNEMITLLFSYRRLDIFDTTQSYPLSFTVASLLSATGCCLLFLIPPVQKVEKSSGCTNKNTGYRLSLEQQEKQETTLWRLWCVFFQT